MHGFLPTNSARPMPLMQAYEPQIESAQVPSGTVCIGSGGIPPLKTRCIDPLLKVFRCWYPLLPLHTDAALRGKHSPEAMKLRAKGMPGNVSACESLPPRVGAQRVSRGMISNPSVSARLRGIRLLFDGEESMR